MANKPISTEGYQVQPSPFPFARVPAVVSALLRGTRARLASLALVGVVTACAAATSSAQASVPQGFFGMNWDQGIAFGSSSDFQKAQWAKMASSGVQAVRIPFYWGDYQPSPNRAPDFSLTDQQVTLAATNGIDLLPTVFTAPRWASVYHIAYSPPKIGPYTTYITELIRRYGPSGTFWSDNPSIPKRPIRYWQIWNEANMSWQFGIPRHKDWGPIYAKILKAAYHAVKSADPSAKVVVCGLANNSPSFLAHLYRSHIHGFFDAVDIHPYTTSAKDVFILAKRTRNVMRQHGDGGKQLWLGELNIPASKGRTSSDNPVQTSDKGMASFLTTSYRLFANASR